MTLASLKVCYDLTPNEMKTNPICPHCRYSLEDKAKNVYGQLDNLEDRIDALVGRMDKAAHGHHYRSNCSKPERVSKRTAG